MDGIRPSGAAEARFAAIIDAGNDYVVTAETAGRIVFANRAARTALEGGVPPGADVFDIYSNDARRLVHDDVLTQLQRCGRWTGTLATRLAGDGVRDLPQTFIAHYDDAGAVECFSVIARAGDQADEHSTEADGSTTLDRVTGLVGREVLVDQLDHCRLRSARSGQAYAVLFCDLDGFKLVNDVFGHDAGDAVLAAVAERLRILVRPYDTVARFGGDEFVILLEDVPDAPTVLDIGQRIVRALSEPIALAHASATIGVSVGAAVSSGGGDSPLELIAHADAAMYEAKHAGKGRVELFGAALDSRLTERRELGNELRFVLERSELELCYRSVASLNTGDITGLEASVRWNHPTRGVLPPDAFIPVASTTGMIEQIDQWVLASAAADIASWRSDHPELVAWVTLSGRLLTHNDGAQRILAILAETNADARSIGIEISEAAIVRNYAETAAALRELHDGGVCIALDNFSGQLTVAQLQTLRPATVKLDRGFLTQLGATVESARAIRSLSGMIRPLGITVVAKGVDTQEQLAAVIALNVDSAQGAIIGPPTAASALTFKRHSFEPYELSGSV
jgi:diguanylate cyclase